ncbi:MAG: amidase domain-containing protein [Bifidobacteriaceae bacterium]|nr:amidase domain-containing protein [Bifidobacteriaceae bacterium]
MATAEVVTTVVSKSLYDKSSVTSSWADEHVIALAPTSAKRGAAYQAVSDGFVAVVSPTVAAGDFAAAVGSPSASVSADLKGASAAASEANARVAGPKAAAQPKVDTTKFADYALKWTRSPYDGDAKADNNPAYPMASPNCTNFGSQVLDQAGFSPVNGNWLDGKNSKVWTYNLSGPDGATWTWVNAHYNNVYVYNYSGRYNRNAGNIWNTNKGDIIWVDWDPRGQADGTIDHMLVVTGKKYVTGKESPTGKSYYSPLISQKSNNRHNVPLQTFINLASQQGHKTIVWRALVANS